MSVSPAEAVFYFCFPAIIADAIVFARFIHKLYIVHDENTRKISQFQQVAHIICFGTILLTSISDTLHGFGSMWTDTTLRPHIGWIQVFHVTADVFYFISSLTLYIILVQRLFWTFNNTSYQISKYFLLFIAILIIIQALVMILYCLNVAIFDCSTPIWCHLIGILSAIITVIDYILNIILFTLFISKLRQLVIVRLQGDTSDMNINDALNNTANNRLLNVITKQTLIGVFITIFNQSFGTCVFLTEAWNMASETKLVYPYITRGIEGMFVCFFLYLGLYINNNEYMKICGFCHQLCNICCIQKTKRAVTDNDNSYRLMAIND
eukprot:147603_1